MELKPHQPGGRCFPSGAGVVVTLHTDEAQLGELQDHPLLQRLLQSKVLHGGEVVGTGDDVVLQLSETIREDI